MVWTGKERQSNTRTTNGGECARMWRKEKEKEKMWASEGWKESSDAMLLGLGWDVSESELVSFH